MIINIIIKNSLTSIKIGPIMPWQKATISTVKFLNKIDELFFKWNLYGELTYFLNNNDVSSTLISLINFCIPNSRYVKKTDLIKYTTKIRIIIRNKISSISILLKS